MSVALPQPANGFPSTFQGSISPKACCHTGGVAPAAAADFNDTTPSATETYMAEVTVPFPCLVSGIAIFSGSVWSDNFQAALLDANGSVLATTASTAGNTTADTHQKVAVSTPVRVQPGTYFVALQINGTTSRFNSHIKGIFGAGKATGTTYGTFTGLTVPTTFTTALGPVATLY